MTLQIKLGVIDRFENRWILSALLAGITELLLGLSIYGHYIGERLSTFGYLGIGMILMSVYHYLLVLYNKYWRKQ